MLKSDIEKIKKHFQGKVSEEYLAITEYIEDQENFSNLPEDVRRQLLENINRIIEYFEKTSPELFSLVKIYGELLMKNNAGIIILAEKVLLAFKDSEKLFNNSLKLRGRLTKEIE